MKGLFKRYLTSIILLGCLLFLYLINKDIGEVAIKGTLDNIWGLLKLVPPIFVLLGLMDVWVPKDKIITNMGESSKIKGGILAIAMGSLAAGPLYASFPVASMLLRKGASIKNVMIFVGTWAACKVPMLLIEVSSLGISFTLIRLTVELSGIIVIGCYIEKTMSPNEKELIYINAKKN